MKFLICQNARRYGSITVISLGPAQVIHEDRPVTDVLVVATINRWPDFGFGVDTGIRFRVRRFRHRIRCRKSNCRYTACEIGVLAFFQGESFNDETIRLAAFLTA